MVSREMTPPGGEPFGGHRCIEPDMAMTEREIANLRVGQRVDRGPLGEWVVAFAPQQNPPGRGRWVVVLRQGVHYALFNARSPHQSTLKRAAAAQNSDGSVTADEAAGEVITDE